MVLYHVYSEYNVFQAYVHMSRFHNLEDAVLLIGTPGEIQPPRYLRSDNRLISRSYVENCKTIFEKVALCDTPPDYYDDDNTFEENLNDYYLDIFEREKIDIKEIKTAYTFCSFERFSVFCLYNQIPLSVIEPEPGSVSQLSVIKKFDSVVSEYRYKYLNKYDLYLCDTNDVKERICNFAAQEDNFIPEGYVDFNPYTELCNLVPEQVDRLGRFYGIKEALGDNTVNTTFLIAGNDILREADPYVDHGHFLYTKEKQAMAHSLILDLFVKSEDVVIVNGINNHYDFSQICTQAKKFIKDIPVEMIAYYIKDTGCPVIASLRQDGYCFKNRRNYLEIATRFLPEWQKYRFFDSAVECDMFMKLVEFINTDKEYKVGYNNISTIIRKLYNTYFDDGRKFVWADVKKPLESSIVYINDGSYTEKGMEELPNAMNKSVNSVYFFANQRHMSIFKDKNISYNGRFLSFTVNKKITSENSYLYTGERRIWIYCTDTKLAELVEGFVYSKLYTHCNAEITCTYDNPMLTDKLFEQEVVPKSALNAKKVVLCGSKDGVSRYYSKIKEKYANLAVCIYEEGANQSREDGISFDKLTKMSGIYVLIATDNVKLMQELSIKLKEAEAAYDHCMHHITGNVSIFRLVAMKRYDYTDDKNNHYIIDKRLKIEDAKKIFVSFMNGKTRFFNTFKIGMIRIGENLNITLKGDYNTISIGKDTTFRSTSIEICQNAAVNIGDRCMFSYSIVLYRDDMHNIYDMESLERLNYPKDINIGNHVWIGRECLLLGGATIGDNCVVGARCVTSSKFPSNTVIAGCPGKAVRKNIVWSRDGYDTGGTNIYENFDRMAFTYMDDSNMDDFT